MLLGELIKPIKEFAITENPSGIGQTLWYAIIGRVISGLGASGMTSLVSILIAGRQSRVQVLIVADAFEDLVPVRRVAKWVSYVNVAATTGRCLGGPVGGWIADAFSWRWYVRIPRQM